MSDFLSCTKCRPIWQAYRPLVMALDLTPERRSAVINAYMDRIHRAGHDEEKVRQQLQAEHEAAEAARREIRNAVAFWALLGDMIERPTS